MIEPLHPPSLSVSRGSYLAAIIWPDRLKDGVRHALHRPGAECHTFLVRLCLGLAGLAGLTGWMERWNPTPTNPAGPAGTLVLPS